MGVMHTCRPCCRRLRDGRLVMFWGKQAQLALMREGREDKEEEKQECLDVVGWEDWRLMAIAAAGKHPIRCRATQWYGYGYGYGCLCLDALGGESDLGDWGLGC